jgi:drug/metabolite transporter (DMT)-like permease
MPPAPALAAPRWSPAVQGLAWGLSAAGIWAVYAVLARLGIQSGLAPVDLTLLRFLPAGLVMAPLLWRWGWRDLGGIGWRRGLLLTLLAGPGFSLLFMTGFSLAPLAHGAVIAPACQMLAGLLLSAWIAHQGLTRQSLVGAAFIGLGLAGVGWDGLRLAETGGLTPLGDVLFALAGVCWGLFGALSRRWRVDPLRVTGVVAVMAMLIFVPAYLALADVSRLLAATPGMLALQVLFQGLGAGLVAMLAFSRAVALLGSARAAFFGAIVPGASSLLAIPVLGEVPTGLQVLGIVAVVLGLLVAFGAAQLLLDRRDRP